MLIALKRKGKWNGKRYVFSAPFLRRIYRGSFALAQGGGGGTTEKFTPTGPWSQQIPYIQSLFGEASNLYGQGPPQYYPDNTVAGANPNLTQSQQNIYGQTGSNNALLNGAMQGAAQNAGMGTIAGNVAQGQIMPYNLAINQLLSSSMNNPTAGLGQTALPAFYGGLQQASQGAQQVQTPQTQFGNVNANPALMSSLYSNGMNPFTSQIVDAALRNQNQQFAQNVLPQISTQANMAGQLGGTRHGLVEGMAANQHQLAQKDLISQLYGQAFDVGSQERLNALGLVGQGQQANAGNSLAAQQLAEQQRQATMQSGLGQAGLVGNLVGQGQQLGSNAAAQAGQLSGSMIGTGSGQNLQNYIQSLALMPGLNQAAGQNLSLANQTGLQQQGMDQANIDAAVERWFYNQYAPYNMLTQYQNWITGPYGASQDSGGSPFGAGPNGTPTNLLNPIGVGGPNTGIGAAIGTALTGTPEGTLTGGLLGNGFQSGQFTGTINPMTGTVDIPGQHLNKEALLSQYLQTGVWPAGGGGGGRLDDLKAAIAKLYQGGYTFGGNQTTQPTVGQSPYPSWMMQYLGG